MYIKPGARELLLAAERQKFLHEQWPRIQETIRRLGLDAEELLGSRPQAPAEGEDEER
jgi:GntR family transcriptional regulator